MLGIAASLGASAFGLDKAGDFFKSSKPELKGGSSLSSAQQPIETMLGQFYQERAFKGLPEYQGEFVAPLGPEYEKARQLIASFDDTQFSEFINQALEEALSGIASMDVSPSAVSKLFAEGVKAPMVSDFQRRMDTQVREDFAAHGALGSTRYAEAKSRAFEELNRNLTSELSMMQYQALGLQAQLEESAKQRQLGAVGEAQKYKESQLGLAGMMQQLGAPYQAQAQAGLDAQREEWMRTQPEYNPLIQGAQNFLGTDTMTQWTYKKPDWMDYTKLLVDVVGAGAKVAGAGAGGG